MDEKKRGNSGFLKWLGNDLKDIGQTFARGDWKTRLSFLIMGFGQLCRGQIVRGLSLLALQGGLLYFIFGFGWQYLTKILSCALLRRTEKAALLYTGITAFSFFYTAFWSS